MAQNKGFYSESIGEVPEKIKQLTGDLDLLIRSKFFSKEEKARIEQIRHEILAEGYFLEWELCANFDNRLNPFLQGLRQRSYCSASLASSDKAVDYLKMIAQDTKPKDSKSE